MYKDAFSGKILPAERILWSGQAGQGILFTARDTFLIPFSLMWCGFAVFWEASAINATAAPDFFDLWGAMFVCFGLYFVFGRFLVDAWIRHGMFYAVTDQRVLIVRSRPFAKFTTVSLARLQEAQLSESANGRGTIRFGQDNAMWGRQGMGTWSPALDSTPQFLKIEDVRRVFDLVQKASPNR